REVLRTIFTSAQFRSPEAYRAKIKKPLELIASSLRAVKPEIVADSAHAILTRNSRECTGNFFIDDEVLREEGVEDMNQYAVDPNQDLFIDFFLDS
ncbi:MAG: DUF1800 family protein, partial [Acidobacteria bacterium]|nr:DUF1800 family protein [Acidobacteriota bacterium]